MTTLSITRALVELKTLDSRINKALTSDVYIVCKTKQKNFHIVESEFKKTVEANFQSVNDLINRRNAIKNAIILSNVNTMVEVAGEKMSVAAAIEKKNMIAYKKNLLFLLKDQRQKSIIESEAHKIKVQAKIDTNIQLVCGKDKPDAAAIQSISESITKGDPVEIYDPLGLDTVIANLEKTIEDFVANVDYVLSESNALTTIEI